MLDHVKASLSMINWDMLGRTFNTDDLVNKLSCSAGNIIRSTFDKLETTLDEASQLKLKNSLLDLASLLLPLKSNQFLLTAENEAKNNWLLEFGNDESVLALMEDYVQLEKLASPEDFYNDVEFKYKLLLINKALKKATDMANTSIWGEEILKILSAEILRLEEIIRDKESQEFQKQSIQSMFKVGPGSKANFGIFEYGDRWNTIPQPIPRASSSPHSFYNKPLTTEPPSSKDREATVVINYMHIGNNYFNK